MSARCAPSAMRMPISWVRLAEGVGHDSVDADRGEQERDAGEDAENFQSEAALRHGSGDHFVHGAHTEQRKIRINGLNFRADLIA